MKEMVTTRIIELQQAKQEAEAILCATPEWQRVFALDHRLAELQELQSILHRPTDVELLERLVTPPPPPA